MNHLGQQLAAYKTNLDKLIALRLDQEKLTRDVLDPSGAKLRTEIEQLQNWAVSKAGNTNTMILAGEALLPTSSPR
jgi:hypothetical protein